MGSIEQKITELATQGLGRPTIVQMLEDDGVTDWQVRRVLSEFRAGSEDLSDDEKKMISTNVRPSHFEVVSHLAPIEVKVPRNRKVLPVTRAGTKVICIGDTHTPFADEAAVDIACQIISDENPDVLVHLGDMVDFYSVSKYSKDPTRRLLLQDELETGGQLLGRLDQAVSKSARKVFIRGNHEHRLEKYISDHAPALAGLPQLQLDTLLGLGPLGWEYVKHDFELVPGLLLKHGELVRGHAGYSAKGEMEKTWLSGASGHTHRLSLFSYTPRASYLRKKQSQFWVECGCLCDMSPDYIDGTANWQQGFAILHIYDDVIIPELIYIAHGKAMHRGKLYQG